MTKRERDKRHDTNRRYDQPWRALYKTKRWYSIRQHQLTQHPLCKRHLDKGDVVAATIVHHVDRHQGNEYLFYNSRLESLCKPCHDAHEQQAERYGYSLAIGNDGWPTDHRHPANR
jgi:5-methylcytosine-specific restriction protein A